MDMILSQDGERPVANVVSTRVVSRSGQEGDNQALSGLLIQPVHKAATPADAGWANAHNYRPGCEAHSRTHTHPCPTPLSREGQAGPGQRRGPWDHRSRASQHTHNLVFSMIIVPKLNGQLSTMHPRGRIITPNPRSCWRLRNTLGEKFKTVCRLLEIHGKAGLVMNSDKFQFGQDTKEFAGMQGTKTGIRPACEYLKSIENFPVLTNILRFAPSTAWSIKWTMHSPWTITWSPSDICWSQVHLSVDHQV